MVLSILIDANGNAAIATVDKLGKAVKTTGAETESMGRKSGKAAAEVKTVGNAAGVADAKVDALSTAQHTNAATAKAMGAANRISVGNMGNLTAQVNDVSMSWASGQAPMMTAIQQYSQITQVIGPMGATGALKALGGAVKTAFSPMTFLTIAAIAGGGA